MDLGHSTEGRSPGKKNYCRPRGGIFAHSHIGFQLHMLVLASMLNGFCCIAQVFTIVHRGKNDECTQGQEIIIFYMKKRKQVA